MTLTKDALHHARLLLTGEACQALQAGAATVLLQALEPTVANAVSRDRAPVYITLLYAMLILRRGHELEPLHEDLERFAAAALENIDPGRDDQSFSRDLEKLIEWKCIDKRTEPLKIRGYKDLRRERFRYRLTEDAVSMLSWLEARLEVRMQGRVDDGRDLLVDVLGQLRELGRIVSGWGEAGGDEDSPRRAVYLLTLVDDRAHAIAEEFLTFREAMLIFSSRPYNLDALREILVWLERYVGVYLARIETLRVDIAQCIMELLQPRSLAQLVRMTSELARERADTPAAFRTNGVLRDAADILDSQWLFFEDKGRLVSLCARISDSVRAVLQKMHRHLRELERRSARLEDLRARIAEVGQISPLAASEDVTNFLNALVGSAHARFGGRHEATEARLPPPMWRKHTPSVRDRPQRTPLRAKKTPPEAVRLLRARQFADLKSWLEQKILRGLPDARLSHVELREREAPRQWLNVAKARYLERGRNLVRLGVTIEDLPVSTSIGDSVEGLSSPDCVVRKREVS